MKNDVENEKRIEEISNQLIKLARDKDCNDWPFRNQILYTECNLGLWVQICERALIGSEDDIAKIRLLLEVVNGLRRQKSAMESASIKLESAGELIALLPDDYPQKVRLLELCAYHGAIIFHALGRFDDAAKCHALESRLATDNRGRWLAIFNQQLAIFYASLSEGKTPIDLLDVAVTKALEVLSDDSVENNRWRANILCHYVFCSWLAGKDREVNTDWAIRYLQYQLPKDLAPAFSHALPVIEAIKAYWDSDYSKALKLANSEKVKGDLGWYGNALLVQLAVRRKQHRATRQILAEIGTLSVNGCGGHVAKAAAEYVGLTLILD